jgi:uncharacterized secreted repeat protein (TIGR03808 family)
MLTRRLVLASAAGLVASPALARFERRDSLLSPLRAVAAREEIRLPKGVTVTRGLRLAPGARLVADRAGSTLRLIGEGPLLTIEGGRVEIEGVAFDGAGREGMGGRDGGLIEARDAEIVMQGCVVRDARRDAIRLERCGGKIVNCAIRGAGRAGLFSLDAAGLTLRGLHVEGCGDNGVQIWGSSQRMDGTSILDCRIHGVENRSGGSGQYGNGVSIFRAGGVTVKGCRVSKCAFSALRNNGGREVKFIDNACVDARETAIFAEFSYRDVTITGNLIDGGSSGIQMTNFADAGGRGGVCADNVIRGLHRFYDPKAPEWGGESAIKVEAETLVARNVIEGSPWIGVQVGWGPSLKDVRVENNQIKSAPIAIAVSVAPGAGRATIKGNRIEGAQKGAILAMRWDKIVSGDLTREPNTFATLTLDANVAS